MGQVGEIEIPNDWQYAADHIIQHRCRRILVIGRSDRGKSSFCRYILGRLEAEHGIAAFVDADIAQKDVGPPGTVSLARFGPGRGNAPAYDAGQLLGLYFVGAVSPQGHFLDLVVGTRRMAERAASLPAVIDTTGLVTGPGHALKRAQIESLGPDAMVMLEWKHELGRLAAEYRYLHPLRLSPARAVRRRSAAERRQARSEAFRRYFLQARTARVDWERIVVQRGRLRENLLCGLGDSRGDITGLGLVSHLDRDGPQLLTPVTPERIVIVQAGELVVTPDGHHHALGAPHRAAAARK